MPDPPEVPAGAAAQLRLGPLLRWVDEHRATVWVETDRPGTVTVLGADAPTFTVHGHHYALVIVEDLQPGRATPYDVRVDGRPVWPPPDWPFPPPVIRPLGGRPLRVAFGSCRALAPYDGVGLRSHGADALVGLAHRLVVDPAAAPDLLLLLGDQVYADEPSPAMRRRLRSRSVGGVHRHRAVRAEACDFEEYTWLYAETWSVPAVRWLLSTVPTGMILDDHDLRDDWNSSVAWRRHMASQPWWRDRVVGSLGSYWVYQHLGNLAPEDLATEPTLAALRAAPDDAARDAALDRMAWRADRDPHAVRWSFARDLGRSRLVVVDSRCARVLAPERRAMVEPAEWAWVRASVHGDVDHLLLGTSLPWLLPPTVHELEGWNEATAAGAWGRRFARVAEAVRWAVDLEHWAAFRRSFDQLADLLGDVAAGRLGTAPASVLVLSGDIHSSYAARVRPTGASPDAAPVWQLVMSPFRNPLAVSLRAVNAVLARRPVRAAVTWLARRAAVAAPVPQWEIDHGPWFDNGVMTVVLDGRSARLELDTARVTSDGDQVLRRRATVALTGGLPGPADARSGRRRRRGLRFLDLRARRGPRCRG